MSPLDKINEITHLLPLKVIVDIDIRIKDWLASGGSEYDPYIEQQLRYAEHIAHGVKEKWLL